MWQKRTAADLRSLGSHVEAWAESMLALLGRHHIDTTWDSGHLLTPTFRALRLCYFMLRDGLGTLEYRPAFLATVIVSGHGLTPTNRGRAQRLHGEVYPKLAEGGQTVFGGCQANLASCRGQRISTA